ncbi:hypothetical protein Hanom_Chr10g00913161 [Helianthus anomalus]
MISRRAEKQQFLPIYLLMSVSIWVIFYGRVRVESVSSLHIFFLLTKMKVYADLFQHSN